MKQQWHAQWIWADLEEAQQNVYVEARTTFPLDNNSCQEAILHVSANQEYLIYVNGQEVGRGPSPCDNDWQYYDTYDVKTLLGQGVNSLAVLAYNFGSTDIVIEQMQGPGGLIVQLELVSDGLRTILGSSGCWKARRSPRWVEGVSRQHRWGGFKEIYRADQEDGWEELEYDDSSWSCAVVVSEACVPEGPWPRLLAREIPFLAQTWVKPMALSGLEAFMGALVHPEKLLETGSPSGTTEGMVVDASVPGSLPSVTFDFEKERVGYVVLDVIAAQGGVLQLSYGESLDVTLYDTILLKSGENRVRPFGRRAFRYLKLTFQAAPVAVSVKRLEVCAVHYPFEQQGSFYSSNHLLEQIWETGRYTTLVNSQEHLEDCPLRERALWVADAIIMGKVIYQTFGDSQLLRKCLLQGARIQNMDGSIPGTGPERNSMLLPDFCAHFLFGVADYWHYTGDKEFLQEMWPAIQRLDAWFEAQEDEYSLFSGADREGWWCFIDWADYLDKRDRVTAVSCFYYKMLGLIAEMADALTDQDYAENCLLRAKQVYQGIRSQLWLPERRAFADCRVGEELSGVVTAQTNFAAIWSGVMTEEEAKIFLEESFFGNQCEPIKGAFFYHIVLETLLDYGYVDEALERMQSYWGEMLSRGATTWWETFDPTSLHCNVPSPVQGNTPTYLMDHIPVSFCHGWGAAPTYLLTQWVVGIDASRLGDGVVYFRPCVPHGLDWAEATVPTSLGDIHARWERGEKGEVLFEAELPDGLSWEAINVTKQSCSSYDSKQSVRGIISNL